MTEKETNDKPSTLITLELQPESREFQDIGELKSWVSEQKAFFGWLLAGAQKDGNSAQVWNATSQWISQVEQFVTQYVQYANNENQQQQLVRNLHQQIKQVSDAGHLITSDSPDAVFGKNLAAKEGEVVACYAMSVLLNIASNQNKPEALLGAYWSFQYRQGSESTVETHTEALEKLKRRWSQKYSGHDKHWRTQNENFSQEISELRKQHETLKLEIETLREEQKTEFESKLSESEGKLKDIEKTYDEKLALQSSVSYWTDKRKRHNEAKRLLGIVTIVAAVVTVGAFIYAADVFLRVRISEVDLWRISVMVAISTFGVWLTRLFAKIFLSNLHLRTDADERVTMIQTYLAMMREDAGPTDGERQLILQTLFRPSTSGFIKDDGPTSFQELLAKTMLRKNL